MTSASAPISAPLAKSHYEVLDGLRGVAALLGVVFHIFEPNDNGVRFKQIINHGYLAVDFSFCSPALWRPTPMTTAGPG